jgi:hypothetical protein
MPLHSAQNQATEAARAGGRRAVDGLLPPPGAAGGCAGAGRAMGALLPPRPLLPRRRLPLPATPPRNHRPSNTTTAAAAATPRPPRHPPFVQLSAVQFYLITTTILLLSREGFRRGCMRVKDGAATKVGRGLLPLAEGSGLLAAALLLCVWAQPGRCALPALRGRQLQRCASTLRCACMAGSHVPPCSAGAESRTRLPLFQGKPGVSATDRVLAVSWLALPAGALVSAAVVAFTLWRSPGADPAYRQAVVLHGGVRARRAGEPALPQHCHCAQLPLATPHPPAASQPACHWSVRGGDAQACRQNPFLRPALPAPCLIPTLSLRTIQHSSTPHHRPTLIVGVAAMLELAAEPFYIIASTQLRFGLRAGVDTAAMLLRGALTLGLLVATTLPPALVFSAAQLAFAGVVLAGYLAFAAAPYAKVGRGRHRPRGCCGAPTWLQPAPRS